MCVEGGKKIKINKRVSTFIREMSVGPYYWLFEFTSAQCMGVVCNFLVQQKRILPRENLINLVSTY